MAQKKTVSIIPKSTAESGNQPPSDSPDRGLVADQEETRRLCGRLVYGTVYTITYGVVYGALTLGRILPGSALIGQAIRDGHTSARSDFEQSQTATGDSLADAGQPA
jgi:hypothetical protein